MAGQHIFFGAQSRRGRPVRADTVIVNIVEIDGEQVGIAHPAWSFATEAGSFRGHRIRYRVRCHPKPFYKIHPRYWARLAGRSC